MIAILRKPQPNSAEINSGQTRHFKVRKICERAAESLCGWIEPEVDALSREAQLVHSPVIEDVGPEDPDTPRWAALFRVHPGQRIGICKQVWRQRAVGPEPARRNGVFVGGHIVSTND